MEISHNFGRSTFENVRDLVIYIQQNGEFQTSRLGPVHEILNAQITIPSDSGIYRPGMAPRLGLVEMLQVVSGYFDERLLKEVAPNLLYDYGLVHAYGIKIAQQLPNVINQLRNNPSTRRAIVYIGKPEDGYEVEKPCMQMLQFQIRNGQLYTSVYVRSWDVVSGLPYDVVVMNGLAQIVAAMTETNALETTFMVASAHVYLESWQNVVRRFSDRLSVKKFQTYKIDQTKIPYDLRKFEGWRRWAMDGLNDLHKWVDNRPLGVIYK